MAISFNIGKTFSRNKLQILWSISIILISYFIFFTTRHISEPSNGFASYYTSSRLLIDGENPKNFYDDDYFSRQVEKFVPGIYEIYLVNLPTTSFLLLPFASLEYQTARMLWILFNLILFSLTLVFIIMQMKFDDIWFPIFLILIFSFQPLYENIVSAQAYIFIFCLLIFVFFGYIFQKFKLPGILLGLVLILKSAGTFLFLFFLINKRWQLVIFTILTFISLFLVSLPLLGLDSLLSYANKLLDYSSNPSLSVTAYQSVHSFFHHLFIFDDKWNPYPLLNLPLLAKVFTLIVSLMIVYISFRFVIRSKNLSLGFAIFIIIGLILNPASIDYHYVLILIPLFVLLDYLRKNPSTSNWIIYLTSFLLIALDLPYTSSKIASGFLALLAYPKLYGAFSLWLLNLIVLKRERKVASQVLENSVL